MVYFSIFITGASVLILEIIGTKVLAPFFGSGLYVWSSLIIVTLAYLSAGYYLGGKWADREPSTANFYRIIFFAGLALLVLFQYKGALLLLGEKAGFRFGPLVTANFLFGLPLGLLGMLGPFAIRLIARQIDGVGGKSGSIFAFSTLGSLAGALLAGFFLLPILSVTGIIYVVSLVLMGLGLVGWIHSNGRWQDLPAKWHIWLLILAVGVVSKNWLFSSDFTKSVPVYEKDNFYGHNRVVDFKGEFFGNRCFVVDGAYQSCYRKLAENEESVYAKIGKYVDALEPGSKVLILGLGGGTILKNHHRQDVEFEAVDINPEAIKVAKEFFALDELKNVSITEADARMFLKSRPERSYDLIINDLYNALSVPEHMVTKEAFALMKSRLKPGGLVVANVIGLAEGDKFVRSLMATAAASFRYYGLKTIAGSGLTNIALALSNEGKRDLVQRDQNAVIDGIVLTDDKNPVEKLRGNYMAKAREAGFVLILPGDYR